MKEQKSNQGEQKQMTFAEMLSQHGTFKVSLKKFVPKPESAASAVKMLAGVTLTYKMDTGERGLYIRGMLKKFMNSGDIQMDWSNSMKREYQNSDIPDSLKSVLGPEVVGSIFKTMEDEVLSDTSVDFKIIDGQIVPQEQHDIVVHNEQAIQAAQTLMTFATKVKQRIPQVAPAEHETQGEQQTTSGEDAKKILEQD